MVLFALNAGIFIVTVLSSAGSVNLRTSEGIFVGVRIMGVPISEVTSTPLRNRLTLFRASPPNFVSVVVFELDIVGAGISCDYVYKKKISKRRNY
jgi:hypothetical protein